MNKYECLYDCACYFGSHVQIRHMSNVINLESRKKKMFLRSEMLARGNDQVNFYESLSPKQKEFYEKQRESMIAGLKEIVWLAWDIKKEITD